MASSSSSCPTAPVISCQSWKYHVFLSFRGEDTRNTFVDHLYTALEQQGIYTYKDDERLPRGNSIHSSLMKAIEESQIAVVIFSENYADSSWCLDELACIMKCKETKGQIVMPVFYDVDPSEIRKQKRKYGEAFLKHELENKKKVKSWRQAFLDDPWRWLFTPREQIRKYQEALSKQESENKTKVESWKKALVDAGNISGWEPKHVANGHESKCIKEIVDTISHTLHPMTLSVDDNLVGVEARMQDLKSELEIGLGGKKMIGIWGVGGGGKTTLASSMYDAISRNFDGSCFIENVREVASKNGIIKLQEKVLRDVLKVKQEELKTIVDGRRMIKDRLQSRKVLIVLDDVDILDHLKDLAGSRGWFGDGSRILITTRDEHVLTGHKVDVIHNIRLLNNDEAMKLFCELAPRGHRRREDYEQLSKDVVSYAGGLPLALRVLGCFLCDKDINEWRSALARLKEIPDDQILEKLKISFDGLKPVEKELFLDIACFFRNWRREYEEIVMTLDACGLHPVIGIKVLVQKALITITEDGEFNVHDLVEEMAHYIVRGEHPNNPEKHSRVWKKEDIAKLCALDAATNLDKIRAIHIEGFTSEESQPVLEVTSNMKKLRWINFQNFVDGYYIVSPLRLPEHFPPWEELCCLKLSFLQQKQLWEGYKLLPNLKMIKLLCLNYLIKTPDFSGLPNLEVFIIVVALSLKEIHPSLGGLKKLVCVQLSFCDNLKMFPSITSMKLEIFRVYMCPKVFSHSRIEQNIMNFPPNNTNHISRSFSSGCLKMLNLSSCNLADEDIRSAAIWALPNLQELNLSGNSFVRLNFSLWRLPQLQWLNISQCTCLVELSELPSSIAVVIADGCESLESFGEISNCKWLWRVSFRGAKKLGPRAGDILLESMLQGNARDYFISISLSNIDVREGYIPLLINWVKTYNMPLPHDWYNHFSGILMFVKTNKFANYMYSRIIIKLGVDDDFQSELGHESNQTLINLDIFVGYVSFGTLRRRTGCLNSTYNLVSFSLENENLYGNEVRFGAVLVPKDDPMQTTKVATDSSEFWDQMENKKTFTIQHDLHPSIKIIWDLIFESL